MSTSRCKLVDSTDKIGLGGSCHWCTEAIFSSLIGVQKVEQGWIQSKNNTQFSEAVIVHFDSNKISLSDLIKIHLHTHSCTAEHKLRAKYISAVYVFNKSNLERVRQIIVDNGKDFEDPIVTKTLLYNAFKLNQESYLEYYYKDPSKPFCRNIINPKIKVLLKKFGKHANMEKLKGGSVPL